MATPDDGYVSANLYIQESREAQQRDSELGDRISELTGRMEGYITYKDLWRDTIKIWIAIVTTLSAGAGIAVGIAQAF